MNTRPAPASSTAAATDSATDSTTDAATLVAAARDLAPALRARAAAAEDLRRLPDETVADLRRAGLFRMLQPARCGGWQTDFHAHLDAVETVAAACGSTGWCLGVFQIHSWVLGLMGERAQEDVYGADPDALVAAVLNPRGTARRTAAGDYVVEGFWPFGSGSEHAGWMILGARLLDEAGEAVDECCLLIPAADVEIRDDWRVAGLRGTGSCSLVCKDVTVPAHRYISFVEARKGKSPGSGLHDGTLYRAPLTPPLAIALCGPALGIAAGAIADFAEKVPGRTNPHLRGAAQIDSPLTHQAVAEARASVDAARGLLHRAADDIHAAAGKNGRMKREARARIRMDCAFAVRLCLEAVEKIFLACGGSGLAESHPVQRAWRDLHAVSQHALLQLDTNAEIYGRTLLGLEPGTDIL